MLPASESALGAQSKQSDASLLPSAVEYLPGSHWLQDEAPSMSEKVPARHAVHSCILAALQAASKPGRIPTYCTCRNPVGELKTESAGAALPDRNATISMVLQAADVHCQIVT